MAVDELERDYLRLLHQCDVIENVIAGIKMADVPDVDKKLTVSNIIMHIEQEILDSKYTDAGKDMARINSVVATGRTYWKS